MQGLARCGLLEKFHYLSTVSGGGYIGSWLSAWIKNDPNGIRGVVDELKRRPDSTLNPEPRPIRHLRDFSNYLAPKSGLTSVDFWTLITTFIRNMFLNWLVLISWLAAAMMVPRLYLAAINLQPDWSGLATRHSWYLLVSNLPPDWNAWENSVKQPWNIALAIILQICPLLRVHLRVRRRAGMVDSFLSQTRPQGPAGQRLAIFCDLRHGCFRRVLPLGNGNPNVFGSQKH